MTDDEITAAVRALLANVARDRQPVPRLASMSTLDRLLPPGRNATAVELARLRPMEPAR